MMRDITKVAKRIKAVMPKHNVWRADIDKLITSVSYSAPEQMVQRWGQLTEIVNLALIDKVWKQKMVDILTDKESEAPNA